MKTLPGYYQSKYYDKYGDTFKELAGFAYKMGKDWDTYIVMFDELSQVEDDYWSLLLSDYLEDLKAFALMYRNVSLGHNSILDKAFFLGKMNNLKGYKQRIYSQQVSRKELLVRYYIEYGDLFEMFCKKQGIDLSTTINASPFTIEQYQQYKNKVYGNCCGINYLSDRQCSILLDRIDDLKCICTNTDYAIDYPICNDKRQFIVERVFPYYFGIKKQYEELIHQYSNTVFKMPISQFLTLEQQDRGAKCLSLKDYRNREEFIESDSQIQALKKERDILVKPHKELYKIEYGDNVEPFFYHNKYVVIRPEYHSPERKQAEQKLAEQRLRENADTIQKLKLQIEENEDALNGINEKLSSREKEIESVLQNEYDSFVDEMLRLFEQDKGEFWRFLYNNQNELQILHDQPIKERYIEYLKSHPVEWIKFKSFTIIRFYIRNRMIPRRK